MPADRRRRLEAVKDWVWDAADYDAVWDDGFGHLTAYVHAEGHARVPHSYRTAEDYRLGQWVSVQRGKKESMSAERRQRLEAVNGWVWVTRVRPSKHGRKQP